MSDRTSIEFTRGDDGRPGATTNPVTGCDAVSPGCDSCFAKVLAERFRGKPGHYFEHGFDLQLRPDKIYKPLSWKPPRRIFVNSMSDLFHAKVPAEYIAEVWAMMALAPHHTFLIFTKRHGRMHSLLNSDRFGGLVYMAINAVLAQGNRWKIADEVISAALDGFARGNFAVLPHVQLFVSAENQDYARQRIPALLDTPAAVRGVSLEPLLGPIDLTHLDVEGYPHAAGMYQINALTGRNTDMGRPCADVPALDWVIVGGETGHTARPMHPDWARSLRDQCERFGVPFMFKQWGQWTATPADPSLWEPHAWVNVATGEVADEQRASEGGDWVGMWKLGKHKTGRELDGQIWDEFPRARKLLITNERGL